MDLLDAIKLELAAERHAHKKDNEFLMSQRDKLRAALREIADHKDTMSDWPHTTEVMQRIAREALKD